MPILRHTPGDRAWEGGWYALVGHYGESTDFTVWCDAGDALPPVTATAEFGPLWYVRMDVANELARLG